MIQEDEKIQRFRVRGAHISTICSIALVIFLMGLQFIVLGYTQKIADYVKENIGFTVVFKEFTRDSDIADMQKQIDNLSYVKSTKYISPKEAAEELQADLGHDFIDFLGYNPLLPSVEVHLKAEYMHNDSVALFEKTITQYHIVKEMFYQRDLVSIVNDNVKTISLWLLCLCSLMLIITIVLINNTMRLLIYSKRFIINSMQLVGATGGFIRKPFICKSIIQALAGSLIALFLLGGGLFYLGKKVPEIITLDDLPMIAIIFGILLILGILITLISAFFSVNKYLKMRNSDQIYR